MRQSKKFIETATLQLIIWYKSRLKSCISVPIVYKIFFALDFKSVFFCSFETLAYDCRCFANPINDDLNQFDLWYFFAQCVSCCNCGCCCCCCCYLYLLVYELNSCFIPKTHVQRKQTLWGEETKRIQRHRRSARRERETKTQREKWNERRIKLKSISRFRYWC